MSAATAIGMVSESLRDLLTGEMAPNTAVPVTVLSPDEPGGDRRVNLFLYKVELNPAFENLDWQVSPVDPGRLVPPPLSLNLYYLLTAYAPNDAQLGNVTAHAILGDAMRVFHEHPVLPKNHLVPGLQDAREQLKIIPSKLNLDELSELWSTSTTPFRTSVLYEVSVVQLDQLPEAERPTPERVRTVGIPAVRAPYQPPLISTVDPVTGQAGRVVTVSGSGLGGWQASATLAGEPLLDAVPLSGDQFTLTVPAVLPPGFYELRLDISHLCRHTVFLEVAP